MFITEVAESQVLVIYPGRFQPFHKGHHAVFDHLVSKFGRNNVWIASSNKVDGDRSPFSFSEKAYFMQLTGVPADRIVESTSPYQIQSVMASGQVTVLNPENTVLIFAVSEKDMAEDPRFQSWHKKDGSPAYFQPLTTIADAHNMNEHGYIMTVPTFDFTVLGQPMRSGTELRKMYRAADAKTRRAIIKDLFGRYTTEAEQIMNNKLGTAETTQPVAEPKLSKTTKLQRVPKPKAVSEDKNQDTHGMIDPGADPKKHALLVKARLAHPMANNDQEAMTLYLNDKHDIDTNKVEREEHQLEKIVNALEKEFVALKQQVKSIGNRAVQEVRQPGGPGAKPTILKRGKTLSHRGQIGNLVLYRFNGNTRNGLDLALVVKDPHDGRTVLKVYSGNDEQQALDLFNKHNTKITTTGVVRETGQLTPQAQQASQALQRGLQKYQQLYPNTDHAFATGFIDHIEPNGTIVVAGDNSPQKIKALLAQGGGAQFRVVNQAQLQIAQQRPQIRTVNEYSAKGGDDGEEDVLHQFAKMWYLGDDRTQHRVEQALEKLGWTIGEVEDDTGGVFVVRDGDVNGDSYIHFPVNDLSEGVAEGGVGVVKGGSDPRYSTATMGDQNAVDGNTLGREMRAFGLTGRKNPGATRTQRPVNKNVGKGLREEQELARLIHDYFG